MQKWWTVWQKPAKKDSHFGFKNQKKPNNTYPIKTLTNDFLTFGKFHPLLEYEKFIYGELSKRLYKNKIPYNDITKLAKLKLQMLI